MSDDSDAAGGGGDEFFTMSNDDDAVTGGGHEFHGHTNDYREGYHDYNGGDYHNYGNSYDTNKRESEETNFGLTAFVLSLFILLGLGKGGLSLLDSIEKSNTFESAIGSIIAIQSCGQSCTSSSNGYRTCDTQYSAVIEYTVDESTYQLSSECSSPGATVVNDIKVLYDRSDPSGAVDGSFTALWILPLILIPFGALSCYCLFDVAVKKLSSATETNIPVPVDNGFGNGAPYKPTPPVSTYQPYAQEMIPTPYVSTYAPYTPSGVSPPQPSYNYASSTPNPPPPASNSGGNKPQSNAAPSIFDQMSSGI
jgi:hypothetical protein